MKLSPKHGLITGLLVGLWNISCFTIVSWLNEALSIGIPPERVRAYSGLFGVVILITGIYLGIKAVKIKNGNQLSYGQGVKAGAIMAIMVAVIVACFSYLYCTVINPGYIDYMVNETQKSLVAEHKSPAEIAASLQGVRKQFGTASLVLQALILQFVVGTISSLIIAASLKTKQIKS